jgi:hypothetical protein
MLATVVATGPPHTTDELKRSCFLGHGDGGFFASELIVCPLLVVSNGGLFTWKFRQPVIALGWLQSDIVVPSPRSSDVVLVVLRCCASSVDVSIQPPVVVSVGVLSC